MNTKASGKFTVILTYNDIHGLSPGTYGNGRVVLMKYDEKSDNAGFGIGFSLAAEGREITEAYIYLGDFKDDDDPKAKSFKSALSSIFHAVKKDRNKVIIFGCQCNGSAKEEFARHEGFKFLQCECGGEETIKELITRCLGELPAKPKPVSELKLDIVFASPAPSEYTYFKKFASQGDLLVAGRSDGTIFWNKDGQWKETGLKMKQGCHCIFADGDRFLLGDGACCSGATWSLDLDGSIKKILAKQGQRSGDDNEDLCGNVHGFARTKQGEIIVGTGGCHGEHVYTLDPTGLWKFHRHDPKRYVHRITTANDKIFVVLSGKDGKYEFYSYDGGNFNRQFAVGYGSERTTGNVVEHEGILFIPSVDSGTFAPSSRSVGFIYEVVNNVPDIKWQGAGCIEGFFTLNNTLYAFGYSDVSKSTLLLCRRNGKWTTVADFPESLNFFVHQSTLYAGGRLKKGKDQGEALIYTATIV